ncbi:MAG: PAS domain S-box protein [Halobacteria archaeon]|nr:PAS domain S-box protein [Halobacteria archaeon]
MSEEKIRVLHVDDEPDLGELVTTYLERESERIDAIWETDPRDALEHVDEDIDCVVSNYKMPGMNGLEFFEEINEKYPDLPFILYTGKGSEEIAGKAVSAGVDDYIQKRGGTEQYRVMAKRIENLVSQRRAEVSYREIFEKSSDGIVIHDADTGEIIDANEGRAEMLGYSKDEFLDLDIGDMFVGDPPYTEEKARELIRKAGEGESQKFEWLDETKEGKHIWVEITLKSIEIKGQDRVLATVRDITERKDREHELERYETFLEVSSDLITVVDENGIIQYESPSMEQILGYKPEERIDTNAFDYIHPDDRDRVSDAFVEMTNQPGESKLVEFRARHADGSWKWIESVGNNPAEEALDGYVVASREITRRKDREAKIKRLQQASRDLIRADTADEVADIAVQAADEVFSLPLSGVHLLDESEKVLEPVEVTETVRETLGHEPTYYRSDEEQPASLIWEVLENGDPVTLDDINEHEEVSSDDTPARSGLVHPLGDHGVFIVSSTTPNAIDETDHELIEILASNVTAALDRVARKEELRVERDRFSAIFEMVPEPINYVQFKDGEPIILDVNPAFEETFGYEAENVIGKSGNDVVVPPEHQDEAENIDEIVRAEGTIMREVRRQTADGVGDFLFRSAPVGESGRTDEYFGIYIDISEQKDYERRLERQNKRLEEFASIVSHDLWNPLNVAQGHLELAQENIESEHLKAVSRAHERMQSLIDDLLTLAREGERVTDLERVDLGRLVESCWKNVETTEASLKIETEKVVSADESRLQQLLENLIRNAVEHGGENVTVTVGDLEDGFYVEDDGKGIPEEERAKIFESGYSTSEEGTGFGLNIVEQIAEAHGWLISVGESKEGGARFEITGVNTVD